MATQNPIEQEGTYPLPEAQLDRFFFKLVVGYSGARSWPRSSTAPREASIVSRKR
jgi:MoxR-like ATPase